MAEHLFELLRQYFDQYGYWTLAVALLLENAGLPVPGETVLLVASFLAFSEKELHLPYIIAVGIVTAAVGDNIGYAIGRRGGRPLLDRYAHWFHVGKTIRRGERLFARYGATTIFFARFIFGVRVVAGPTAGVLHMPWKRFVLFNFLGATLWVTVIALLGYFFGSERETLLAIVKRANFGLAGVAAAVVLLLWLRHRRKSKSKAQAESAADN